MTLTAPADGGEILLFPETTVVSVRGIQFPTSAPIALRGGDAWLTKEDAASIESMWAAAPTPGLDRWEPPHVTPLEPRPPQRPPGRAPSAYADQPTPAEVRAWSVSRVSSEWRYIVIHHSASESGNAAVFDKAHKARKWDGLGYQFVIGNGNGSGDGAIEVGYRWPAQKRGAHAGNEFYNIHGIGICLVGDFTKSRPTPAQMRALSRLCNFLSAYCGIPRENYVLHGDVRKTLCPGPLFPRDFLGPARSGRTVGVDPAHDDFATPDPPRSDAAAAK